MRRTGLYVCQCVRSRIVLKRDELVNKSLRTAQTSMELSPLQPCMSAPAQIQVTEQTMKNEPSRLVRICLVKYKCILMITFLVLAIAQMLYIFTDKIISNQSYMSQIFSYLNTRHNNNNNTDIVNRK